MSPRNHCLPLQIHTPPYPRIDSSMPFKRKGLFTPYFLKQEASITVRRKGKFTSPFIFSEVLMQSNDAKYLNLNKHIRRHNVKYQRQAFLKKNFFLIKYTKHKLMNLVRHNEISWFFVFAFVLGFLRVQFKCTLMIKISFFRFHFTELFFYSSNDILSLE